MNKIGERIKKRREYLDLPLNVLAKGVGVSSSLLSQIENAKAFPSLHTIKSIADYLNTSVGALIGENETFTTNPMLEWNERKFVKRNENGATLYLMAHYSPLQTMEIYTIDLEPNGNTTGLLENRRSGQDYCFVIDGSVKVNLTETTLELPHKGSVYFYSHDLKSFQNQSNQPCTLLWALSPLRN